MAITVQLTRWVPLNFTDRRDITWFQIVVTNDLYIFIDLPVHSLTKLTSWNSNWNPKKVLHTQKMVTCTVMASWHRVLHLWVALKINSKQRTKLKTANSGSIYFRSFSQCRALPPIQTPPPVDRMIDACENITLPQTLFSGFNKRLVPVGVGVPPRLYTLPQEILEPPLDTVHVILKTLGWRNFSFFTLVFPF